jgi:ankyrin repeat protein
MIKIMLLNKSRTKNILACLLVFLTSLTFTAAQASCTKLCSENWWRNTSIVNIKLELLKVDNLNARDDYGFRPLHFAVQNGEKSKVRLLLSDGINTNAKTDYGFTPLYFAVGKKGDPEIIEMLINFGASINVHNKNGITPLHYAAWGTAEKIRILLNAGADITTKTNSGKVAFDLAKDNEDLVDTEVYFLLKVSSE